MKGIWNFMAICVIVIMVMATGAFAQEKSPMNLIDLLNVPSLRDPQLSYDGKQILYVLTTADWGNSPLKDISRVKTPTIVLVGQNDVRVPMPQSVELYRALKSNGIPTHLYVALRAGHGWSELRHRLYKMNIELAWIEKYAMEREYTWEKAQGEEAEEEMKNDQ